jgi:hypothetical protein
VSCGIKKVSCTAARMLRASSCQQQKHAVQRAAWWMSSGQLLPTCIMQRRVGFARLACGLMVSNVTLPFSRKYAVTLPLTPIASSDPLGCMRSIIRCHTSAACPLPPAAEYV